MNNIQRRQARMVWNKRKKLTKKLQAGGMYGARSPFVAHEGEIVLPSQSGLVMNKNLSQAILKAGLDRALEGGMTGGGGSSGQTMINAPQTVSTTNFVDQQVGTKRSLPLVAVN